MLNLYNWGKYEHLRRIEGIQTFKVQVTQAILGLLLGCYAKHSTMVMGQLGSSVYSRFCRSEIMACGSNNKLHTFWDSTKTHPAFQLSTPSDKEMNNDANFDSGN